MSAAIASSSTPLSCPLCAHPHFENAQELRDRLIFVSTHNLTCPICKEEVTGLDKLTIHMFRHVKLNEIKKTETLNNRKCDKGTLEKPHTIKKNKPQIKNKIVSSANTPVKYVKIFPKLPLISLNAMPLIEITHTPLAETMCNPLRLTTMTSNDTVRMSESIKNNTHFSCSICGLQFVDASILKMHQSLIHNFNSDISQNSISSYQCHLCTKNFKMKGSLMVHLRVAHYGIASTITMKTVASDQQLKVSTTEKIASAPEKDKTVVIEKFYNKQWYCDICQKSFTTKYFLKKHKRLHTGETPYACVQCNKTFTFQQSYHKHLLYHNDEKPHGCTFCGRSFKELSTLHNHQRIHTGEKPFTCETCGKCFRQRVSYLVHRRIHTGVMPYKCTACDKCFRYKVSQRTHKCPAQPPGTVVRKSGELLEKLKKKHNDISIHDQHFHQEKQSDIYSEVSEANAELVRIGAKLSFEDTEADNFSLISKSINEIESNDPNYNFNSYAMRIDSASNNINSNHRIMNDKELTQVNNEVNDLDVLLNTSSDGDKSVPSPSDILKNLCLSNLDEVRGKANSSPKNSHDDLNLDVIYKELHQLL